MNIDKIINDSVDKSVKNVANGKFKETFNFDNDDLEKSVQQNLLLMEYSITLLKTYHEELKKELAKHGIDI